MFLIACCTKCPPFFFVSFPPTHAWAWKRLVTVPRSLIRLRIAVPPVGNRLKNDHVVQLQQIKVCVWVRVCGCVCAHVFTGRYYHFYLAFRKITGIPFLKLLRGNKEAYIPNCSYSPSMSMRPLVIPDVHREDTCIPIHTEYRGRGNRSISPRVPVMLWPPNKTFKITLCFH